MERIATNGQMSSRALTIYSLPTFVLLFSIVLTVCLGGLLLSTLVGLHMGDMLLHPNPFAAYEALWPGQTIESTAELVRRMSEASLSCVSWEGTNEFLPMMTTPEAAKTNKEIACTSFPKDGVFSAITVSIKNGQVQVLRLVSNFLQQDALFLYWGAPDVVKQAGNQRRWFLQWNRSNYIATALVQETDSVVDDITLLTKE